MKEAIRHLDFDTGISLGFEIIPIDHHAARSRKNLSAPHRASFYCILWLKEGSIIHYIDFTPVQIFAGSFLFIGQDAVQFFDQHNPFVAEVLIFTDIFFCQREFDHAFLKNSTLFNPFAHNINPVSLMASKELEIIWSQMQREWKNIQTLFKHELLKNYLHNFLMIAERDQQQDRIPTLKADIQKSYVLSFMDLLERHFKEQHPITYYTEKIAITNKVLNNAVYKVRGKTPKQIITERIVLEAKRLLVYSTDSIKVIGFELGFGEPTNFVKFFKNNCGMTPASFRDNYLLK